MNGGLESWSSGSQRWIGSKMDDSRNIYHRDLAPQSRNQKRKEGLTAEAQSSQSSEGSLIKSYLGALRVSAVNSLLDRNQASDWKICAKRKNRGLVAQRSQSSE